MRVAVPVTQCADSLDNRLATAEDLLEQMFGVLAWRQVELFCC